MDADRKLLAKRALYDGLILTTPDEGDRATHDRSDKSQ